MKHIYRYTLLLLFLCLMGTEQAIAQYNKHAVPCNAVRSDQGSVLLAGRRPMNISIGDCDFPDPPGGGDDDAGKDEDQQVTFELYFTRMQVLLDMQAALAVATERAEREWLNAQQETFRREINRQLGTNHTSFAAAQRDFFRNYEKNHKKLDGTLADITSDYLNDYLSKNGEQERYTTELYYAKEWQYWRNWCGPHSAPRCTELEAQYVQGKRLGEATSEVQIDELHDMAFADFGRMEYQAALSSSKRQGMQSIIDDNSVVDHMVQNHLSLYNNSSLEDKVYYMTAYLTQYYNRSAGPLTVPISTYRLPDLWSRQMLVDMGMERTPDLHYEEEIFEQPYEYSSPEIRLLQEEVLQRHLEDLDLEALARQNIRYTVLNANDNDPGWVSENGSIAGTGLNSLKYFRKYTTFVESHGVMVYNLNNGAIVEESIGPLATGGGAIPDQSQIPYSNGYYYYVWQKDSARINDLYALRLPETGVSVQSDHYLVTKFWDLIKVTGRYATPMEDALIIYEGSDFDGVEQSQLEAGVWIVVGLIPGSKLAKPVTRIVGNAEPLMKLIKIGDDVLIRVIRPVSDEVLSKIRNAVYPGAMSAIEEAIENGKFFADVIEESMDEILELAEKLERKLEWEEVLALFKRGNDFNKKAIMEKWYDYHEVVLSNGKRLDSYNHTVGEIVSRKATDLDKIQFSTFDKYLKELKNKYPAGILINSKKYKKYLNGQTLKGQQYLEIPDTNRNLSNIQEYIDYAWETYGIRIRFKPE